MMLAKTSLSASLGLLLCSASQVATQATFTLPAGITVPGIEASSFPVPPGFDPVVLSSIVNSLTEKVGATLQPTVIASAAAANGLTLPGIAVPIATATLTGTLTSVTSVTSPSTTTSTPSTSLTQTSTSGTSTTPSTGTSTSTTIATVAANSANGPSKSSFTGQHGVRWLFPIVGLYYAVIGE